MQIYLSQKKRYKHSFFYYFSFCKIVKIHENLLKIKILYKNKIYVYFSIQFLNLRKFFTVFLLTINFTIFFSYQITIPKLNFSSKLRSRPSRPTKPSCHVGHLSLECALQGEEEKKNGKLWWREAERVEHRTLQRQRAYVSKT